ncbi:MAG: tripartite tricarboxylate transporter substrate-binding protein [Rhodospirillales bacterium]
MDIFIKNYDRRSVLKGTGLALGAAGIANLPFSDAFGASFPASTISVTVSTRAGGGADRLFRGSTGVWKKYLDTTYKPNFKPGASGRVGYEFYMGKKKADGNNLLFGNMGPEFLNWVVKLPTFDLADLTYFARVDTDPGVIFVRADSPYKTIQDVVAAAKKKTLNVSTSRLAHPASVGLLALGEHTGAKFNLIPLSGGKNTIAGVVTKEMDLGTLTSGSVAAKGKSLRTLLVFNDKNVVPDRLSNAPTTNQVYGTSIPPLLSSRAFAIQTSVIRDHPDRFKILNDTVRKTFDDPDLKPAILKARGIWEYINYGDMNDTAAYLKGIEAIGRRYRPLLTGKKT